MARHGGCLSVASRRLDNVALPVGRRRDGCLGRGRAADAAASPPDVRYGYAVASLTTLAVAPAFIAWTISRGPLRRLLRHESRVDWAQSWRQSIPPRCRRAAVVVTPFPRSQADAGRVALWLDSVAVALPGVWLIAGPADSCAPCHRVAQVWGGYGDEAGS